MQSIKTYFADLSQRLGLADELIVLSPKHRAAKHPMQLGEVQDQTEHYLDLSSGAEEGKGIFTGIWGLLTIYTAILMAPALRLEGELANYLSVVGGAFGITLTVFLLEVFWPSSSPIRFNRRTREVYFQDKDKLYHVPWDEAVAWMQESRTVTQYTGAMTETPLQLLLQRYGNPEEVIALRLNLPMGRTAETQGMFWEYLRCYMEEGPWFDEQGNTVSASNRKEVLEKYRKKHKTAKVHLKLNRDLVRQNIMPRGRMWATTVFEVFMLPLFYIRDLTAKYARQRAAGNQWHPLVKERCRPDGPTTRLYDLEVAEGLHEGAEMSAAEQAPVSR
ncbi:hypothetical protein DU490_14060 [Halomonas sp. DQ26W]|uniref:DUF6708 domain-containing protein n=1 Tax=Halomonas sp. DQ26W TaxID=2282311 RepID=UPI000DF78E70|nr:DUF6708 domain-containing protein [Halomonas sp. DQ26W]RDB42227.1 hypothetical protein DU490_14060 [Halomonas sp. DQ26W]